MIYLIGSLRNPAIPQIANTIREHGYEVFDDWFAAGPEADDWWQKYENSRGNGIQAALRGYAARNVYSFDRRHLDLSNAAVLALPAGKSGHLELGYMLGCGKKGYVLFDQEPERYDVMYQFATGVFTSFDKMMETIIKEVVK